MPIIYTAEQRYQRAMDLEILVDPRDEWLLYAYTWRVSSGGYISTMMRWPTFQKDVYLHHAIMGQPIYTTECIDHVSRNRRNNQRINLRWATYTENKLNSIRSDLAVHAYLKPNGRYQARIVRYGVAYELGTYDTIEGAQHARDKWLEAHGEFQVGDGKR